MQSYQRFQHIVHTVFNTSGTNAPRSLSHLKVGTHSARRRIAHKGSHAETRGISDGGVVSLPSERSARSRTSPGRVPERRILPLLGLDRVCSQRTQRAFGTAMRLCASLSRGVAAPLGCVIFSVSVEIAACTPYSRNFFQFSRRSSLCCSCASCFSTRSFSARSCSRVFSFVIVLDPFS